MNNLKSLMALNNLTAEDLAKRSGLSVANIRRIMNNTEVTPYRGTAEILAVDAAEGLVRALRDYTGDNASLSIYAEANKPDGFSVFSIHIEDGYGEKITNVAAHLEFDDLGGLSRCEFLQDERRGK